MTEPMRDEHQARLGAQVAALREQQGWSQRALARWVGLDQSAVSRIEAGRRRLSADELQRFADALRVSADVLLKGAPPTREEAPRARIAPLETEARPSVAGEAAAGEPLVLGLRAEPSSVAHRAFASEDTFARRRQTELPPDDFSRLISTTTTSAADAPPADLPGLPAEVAAVARDWSALRELCAADEPVRPWSTGHSAEGKAERLAHPADALRPGRVTGTVLYDRVARFWRSELHVVPDDGPLPDLAPLLEDAYGAQVIVARVAAAPSPPAATEPASSEYPVAAAFTAGGVPFIFVNAARPVVLQRFALAHAFAHLVLGHGDIVDRCIEWSRSVPPEAAANDFAEEFLAPARAVQRWYERRGGPRRVRLVDLLDLGNAFGVSAWSALFRSRAAGRLQGRQFHALRAELDRREWELLPRQAYLGGVKDTLSHLTPGECLPPGAYGTPAVLRVPGVMRSWTLAALGGGRLSVEDAAALLRIEPDVLAEQLAHLGLE